KVGMTVEGIRPTDTREQDYYVEQAFDLKFRGVFVQLRVFLQRLSELNRIVRIGKLELHPITPADSEYVMLEGDVELDTYKYRGSHADELGNSPEMNPAPAPRTSRKTYCSSGILSRCRRSRVRPSLRPISNGFPWTSSNSSVFSKGR